MSNKLKHQKPQTQQTQQQKASVSMQHTRFYQGIIPDAEEMTKYEAIQPGFADRIMKLTEGEANHRRLLDSRVVRGSIAATIFGQICALLSVGGVIWLCYYAFSKGYSTDARYIAIGVLVSIASVFLYKRKQLSK